MRELVRVDLEYAWQRGRPKPLDHYRAAFPDLFARPDDVRQVAFEEFRLRAQAGQAPSPQEYARRYGVDTAGWQATRDDRGRGNGTAREPAAGEGPAREAAIPGPAAQDAAAPGDAAQETAPDEAGAQGREGS